METIKKIKKYIEKYENIHLLASPNLQSDSFFATLALFSIIKNLGKNATLLNKEIPEEYQAFFKEEKNYHPKADFLISIKEAGAKLSQLFYEKTDQGLNLFLKTDGELKKENISLNPLSTETLLITIGVESIEEATPFLKEVSYLALNIDNDINNKKFGQINLIQESQTFSEIIFEIIAQIDDNLFTESVATTLLCGITREAEKENFKLTIDILKKLQFLIEKGGDVEDIEFPNSKSELFAKMLTKINSTDDLGWILLTKDDFKSTSSSPYDLNFILKKLTLNFFPFQNFLFLWEQNSSPLKVRGVFYSPRDETLNVLKNNLKAEQKGQGLLFKTDQINLLKVKDNILEIIKKS